MNEAILSDKLFLCRWNRPGAGVFFAYGMSAISGVAMLCARPEPYPILYRIIIYSLAAMFLALPVVMIWYQRRLVRRSCYVVTADGYLEARYYLRKPVRYPIAEIEQVRLIDDDNCRSALPRYYTYPVSFGRGGDGMVPDTGVLVYFNRRWYKSINPVLLHACDDDGLLQALVGHNPSITVL